MTLYVGVGGVNKAVNALSVGVGGVYKTVTKGWVGVGGVWKVFYETVVSALTASPNPCYGSASGFSPSGPVTSDVCTVSGHSGGVTWARISGGTSMTISNPTGTSVTWNASPNHGTPETTVWRVTNGSNTYDVTVTLTWVNLN